MQNIRFMHLLTQRCAGKMATLVEKYPNALSVCFIADANPARCVIYTTAMIANALCRTKVAVSKQNRQTLC